jgi:WhiB family transcriptional regulator, redox-sensing transcriptional regulator
MVATAPALNPHLCRVCGAPNPPSRGAGRPRRYCGDGCARAGTQLKNRERQAALNLREVVTVPAVPVELGVVDAFVDDAACLEHPEVSWFPNQGDKGAAAIAVCHRCLVRSECLALALREGLTFGIFGGTTPEQRRKMRLAGVDAEDAGRATESRQERAKRLEVEYPALTEEEEEAAEEAEHEAWLAQYD